MRRYLAALVGVFVIVGAFLFVQSSSSALPAQDMCDDLAALVVEPENDTYDSDTHRDPFETYDRDALLAGSEAEFGGYYSPADDELYDDDGDVQVDHIVAIGEAWASGADEWSETEQGVFGADELNLWLMTSSLNQSKSDDDVAEWLPPNEDVVGRYIATWIAVKAKYDLSIDQAEADVLAGYVTCDQDKDPVPLPTSVPAGM